MDYLPTPLLQTSDEIGKVRERIGRDGSSLVPYLGGSSLFVMLPLPNEGERRKG